MSPMPMVSTAISWWISLDEKRQLVVVRVAALQHRLEPFGIGVGCCVAPALLVAQVVDHLVAAIAIAAPMIWRVLWWFTLSTVERPRTSIPAWRSVKPPHHRSVRTPSSIESILHPHSIGCSRVMLVRAVPCSVGRGIDNGRGDTNHSHGRCGVDGRGRFDEASHQHE